MISRILALMAFRAFFFGGHQEIVSVSFSLRHAAQVKPQKPKGFTLQCVNELRLLAVERHTERCELFLESLQSSFGPFTLSVVATDVMTISDDIIGEPMMVHGLIGSLCRLAANRIKGPIHLVQVDIRRQRAERPPLRYTESSHPP